MQKGSESHSDRFLSAWPAPDLLRWSMLSDTVPPPTSLLVDTLEAARVCICGGEFITSISLSRWLPQPPAKEDALVTVLLLRERRAGN
jgi:hypothetical protein